MSDAKLDQIGKALAAARADFRKAGLDGKNDHLRNRYATLGSVIEACEGALGKHGLTFVQPIELGTDKPILRTILIHCESGQTIEAVCPLLFDAGGKLNPMQGLGSAISYARRYSLASLLGIVSGDDDDGEGAYPQHHQQPAHHGPQPPSQSRPDRTTGPAAQAAPMPAGGFWTWCQAAAKELGIQSFQLLGHIAKVMESDGVPEIAGLSAPRDKIQVCNTFWGSPQWQEWFKGEANSYAATLAAKASGGNGNGNSGK